MEVAKKMKESAPPVKEPVLCRYCKQIMQIFKVVQVWCSCHGSIVGCSVECIKNNVCKTAAMCGETTISVNDISKLVWMMNETSTELKDPCGPFLCTRSFRFQHYPNTGITPFDTLVDRDFDARRRGTRNLYCELCVPLEVRMPMVREWVEQGGPLEGPDARSYFSLFEKYARPLLVTYLYWNGGRPCQVCGLFGVLYPHGRRYECDNICYECVNVIGVWYRRANGGCIDEYEVALYARSRQALKKIIAFVNRRIVKSASRTSAKSREKRQWHPLRNKLSLGKAIAHYESLLETGECNRGSEKLFEAIRYRNKAQDEEMETDERE